MNPIPVTAAIAIGVIISAGNIARAVAAEPAAGTGPAPIALPWTARGNEPGWTLTLDESRMTYRTMDGMEVAAPLPKPAFAGGTWIYRAPQKDLTASVQRKICRDTMTEMPSPFSVSVQTGNKTLTGCGGNPSDLLGGGAWKVSVIGNEPVPENVNVSLEFDTAASQVFGSSGCNRYFGAFKLSGEGFRFEPGMAGSMMACEEIPTRIERSFLSAMAKVQRFDIAPDGSLLLIMTDGTIKARRDPGK